MEESCKWLLSKEYFKRWLDDPSRSMRYLWLWGPPGVGKSVLSASVISHLQEQNLRPNFYFFKRGDRVKSTLSGMLCSLAYQIATIHPAVREKLQELASSTHVYDDRGIWTKIFLECVFKIDVAQPYYWVIDALDECNNASSFLSLMSKKGSGLPVRILVTSRPSLSNKFTELGNNVSVVGEEISPEDTLEDIRKYVNVKSRELPVDDEELRQHIQYEILTKSKGSFLWAKLVMNQLCEAHTVEEMERIVHEPPQEMEEFYRETLATIASSSRDVELPKAIFIWTTCSIRPLNVEELQAALELDIKEKPLSLRNSIPTICGQLVYIDKPGRVQMIHETARNFILKRSEAISEAITIREEEGNARLAKVCLEYLCGSEMAPPQSRKRSSTAFLTRKSTFLHYACLSFAEHIRGTSSRNTSVLELLHQFLTTNVQTWIEYVARTTGNLQHMIDAAKIFKHFLDRCAKRHPPTKKEIRTLEMWSTDLIRLVAKFGRNLLLDPASIYGLITPFCPKNSALRQYFGSETRGINVVGLSAPEWDSRLSVMQYAKDVRSTAVAYGPKHFAIGLSIGEIIMYNTITCQEAMKFQFAQKVRFLTFCRDGNRLAASSKSEIRIWDTATGNILHSFQVSDEPLALSFTNGDQGLMTATRGHKVHVYDLKSESEPGSYPWLDDEEIDDTEFRRLPIGLQFNKDQTILAIVYKGLPILIWDIEDEARLGTCERVSHENSRRPSTHLLVIAMVFNPASNLLAAAYGDGDIAVFDSESQDLTVIVEADAQALACSHDGMTLATGDAFGAIQLRDFESLELLYTLVAYDDPIHALAFSTDNLRFVDIRGSKCNVWEPAVLVRATDNSDSRSMSSTAISEALVRPQEEKASTAHDMALVTAVACTTDKSIVCVAKDNGAVSIYDTQNGKEIKELYNHSHHSDISVTRLAWGSKEGLLASADVSTRLKVWKMSNASPREWDTKVQLMDSQLNNVITQILFNPENDLILVSTPSAVTIYRVNGELVRSLDHKSNSTCKWINHPSNPANFISISSSHAYVYDWNTLTVTSTHILAISPASQDTTLTPDTVLPIPHTRMLAVEILETGPNVSKSSLYVFPSSSFGPPSSAPTHDAKALPVEPLPFFGALSPRLERLIGVVAPSTLVFLDIALWVCTINLQKFDGRSFLRHFFVPYDWLSASGHRVLMDVVGQSDVLAVRNDEVAIVQRGLKIEEEVEL
jgi:WD40 repeat protein